MRLQQIKLSGFKSFVEPATVTFGSSMTAIVGPNGCGKSNLIDAVRWVLGESSARHLRGEAMTDVIFNGATGRAPVSRASVELRFDNRGGELGAAYASYAEIAVRRDVTREGGNHYFLNGQACRRRDITELFLGTGLGPRSYAIVEQGMISRLIEARPQELRGFLEEAAGVTKYKARRRETETRMRHCRENLERVADIRTELEQQLSRLARQASAAKRYRQLKQRQRALQARQIVTEWQQLQQQVDRQQALLEETEQAICRLDQQLADSEQARLQACGEEEQLRRRQQQIAGERMAQASEIARLQEQIEHRREQRQQQVEQARELEVERQALARRIQEDRQRQQQHQQRRQAGETDLQKLKQQLPALQARHAEHEQAYRKQRQQQQELQRQLSEIRHQGALLDSRIDTLEQQLQRTRAQLADVDQEGDPLPALQRQLTELAQHQRQQQEHCDQQQQALAALTDQVTQAQHQQEQLQQAGVALEARLEGLGEHNAMLAQLWCEAAGDNHGAGLSLVEAIQVAPGWELAVETVLGPWLDAQLSTQWPPCGLAKGVREQPDEPTAPDTLAAKVRGGALRGWLGRIHCCDDPAEAATLLAGLPVEHSVVSPDGQWLGREWFVDAGRQSPPTAPLQLKARLEQGQRLQQALQRELTLNRSQRQQQEVELAALLAAQEQASQRCNAGRTELGQLEVRLALAEQTLAHTQEQQIAQQRELTRLQHAWVEDTQQLERMAEERQLLHATATELELEWEQQQVRGGACEQQFLVSRQQLEELTDALSQQQQALDRCCQQLQGLEELLQRETARLGPLEARLARLQQTALSPDQPAEASLLRDLLARQAQLQASQQQVDQALSRAQQQIRERETVASALQQQQRELQQKRATAQVARERVASRAQLLREQLHHDQLDVETLLQQAPVDVPAQALADELEAIAAKLSSLGAVNLAAEQEQRELQQRHEFLSQQQEDLRQALATLEQAIVRIDRDTRLRFKETFDRINQELGALFPKMFGGGQAYLELTDADPLEAGVSIMARPPGKRNATIALLSGGEKALTALALVFAFFRQNPAPFCMLDEVDAPLDEVNVGRFCTLVKEMSGTVQFLYISHNKVSMEMATELVGVTMREAGVSRIVSVNLTDAVAMAENS